MSTKQAQSRRVVLNRAGVTARTACSLHLATTATSDFPRQLSKMLHQLHEQAKWDAAVVCNAWLPSWLPIRSDPFFAACER